MAKPKTPGKKPSKTEDSTDEQDQDQDGNDDDNDDDHNDREEENKRINAIVTSRVKREMKAVNTTLQAMQETLKSLAAPKKPEDTDEDEDTDEIPTEGKKAQEIDPKLSRKMNKLEKELADERQARKTAEQEKAQEQEKAKRTEMRTIFSGALTELGITDPKLLRAAINVLEEDGVMIRDEDGKVKFKGVDKYGIETNFDPKAGLKSWVTTEGKSFVPAVDAGGSGTGGARAGGGNGTSLTSKEIKGMSAQQLAAINLERACTGLPPLGTPE